MASSHPAPENKMATVVVDTDPGTDDACALLMLLWAHREGFIRLRGITTVHGNAPLSCVNDNITRILHATDMTHIPVYSGCAHPILPPPLFNNERYHGTDGFGDTGLPVPVVPGLIREESAVDFIVKTVKEYEASGNKIHLLALGPLTNIAVAKKVDPNLLGRLASLHIMGGTIKGEGNFSTCAEFNFICDPEAAKIVLSKEVATTGGKEVETTSTCCEVYIVPWETCRDVPTTLKKGFRQQLATYSGPGVALLNAAEAFVLAKSGGVWFPCDQTSTGWLLDQIIGNKLACNGRERQSYSRFVTAEIETNVTVECQGGLTRGLLILDRGGRIGHSLPVHILESFNAPLLKLYLERAFGKPPSE